MPGISESELLRLSRAEKATHVALKWGVALEGRSGRSIESLIELATRDRYRLGILMLDTAQAALGGTPAQYRLAISRAYYAMYHATRATVYFREGGDDFQEHSELPKDLPGDFPDRAVWENSLKQARLERNKADYDPYPRGDRRFKQTATRLCSQAEDFCNRKAVLAWQRLCAMTDESSREELTAMVRRRFEQHGITVFNVGARQFPGETIVVVEVPENAFDESLRFVNELDALIPDGFITVRKVVTQSDSLRASRTVSIADPKVSALIELLNARSRTSEQQPSLKYVRDAAEGLRVAVSKRHHLIFGRRGVGKTALMLEAKHQVEQKGAQTLWVNIQSMRSLGATHAFLTVASRMCDVPIAFFHGWRNVGQSVTAVTGLKARIRNLLQKTSPTQHQLALLITDLQQALSLFGHESTRDMYVFIDDLHYLSMLEQPQFLDMLHSISRDNAVWLKIAGIKHQTRWFSDNPPIGLQTTHDAAIINLDITLETPAKAKQFLTDILSTYAHQAGITGLGSFISSSALDRLVIASGAVPRDFLLLCANSVQVARQRIKAKVTGVQDVNEAAGYAAQIKQQELEDDAASSIGSAQARVNCLNTIRTFLLDEKKATYFRVEFQEDKESHPAEYGLLQSVMDLRLIHLINSSLSDERHAGRRYEVYALDLSQFSGSRLKYNLKTLDFSAGALVLKQTGTNDPPRRGDTPKALLAILRRGPHFELDALAPTAA